MIPHPIPQADHTVDVLGRYCPVPVMETAKAMKRAAPGQVIQILATDPGIETDLPAWCSATRHEFLGLWREGQTLHVFVRKAG